MVNRQRTTIYSIPTEYITLLNGICCPLSVVYIKTHFPISSTASSSNGDEKVIVTGASSEILT